MTTVLLSIKKTNQMKNILMQTFETKNLGICIKIFEKLRTEPFN